MKNIVLVLLASVSSLGFAQTAWEIDAAHTSIVFKINHMGFSNTYGMFAEPSGTVTLDEVNPEKSSFEIKLPVDKINSIVPKRDDHLRGPDFFNAKQFPLITLKSKSVKKSGDKYEVTADLTVRGITKPVSFALQRNKTGKDFKGMTRTGFDTSFKIKRTDYGVSYMSKPGGIGDEVELMISIELVQK